MASPVSPRSPISPQYSYTPQLLGNWRSEHGNILPNVPSLPLASRGTRGNFLALVSDSPESVLKALLVRITLYPRSVTEIVSSTGLTEGYYGGGLLQIVIRWRFVNRSVYATLLSLVAETPANNIIVDLRDEVGEKYTDAQISEILTRRGF